MRHGTTGHALGRRRRCQGTGGYSGTGIWRCVASEYITGYQDVSGRPGIVIGNRKVVDVGGLAARVGANRPNR